jgi:hypothetical protein
VAVAEPYRPSPDVVSFAPAAHDAIVAEVVVRREQYFIFRFVAWVAWRDAGDTVRDHSWHEIKQGDGIFDRIEDAEARASDYAQTKGIELEAWRAAT